MVSEGVLHGTPDVGGGFEAHVERVRRSARLGLAAIRARGDARRGAGDEERRAGVSCLPCRRVDEDAGPITGHVRRGNEVDLGSKRVQNVSHFPKALRISRLSVSPLWFQKLIWLGPR